MKYISLILIAVLSVPSFAHEPGRSYADLVEKVRSAVVNIQTVQGGQTSDRRGNDPFQFFGRPDSSNREPSSTGTGFVISADGYIVTNRHVVENTRRVRVHMDEGETHDAKVIGIDDSMDLALLKIEANNLSYLDLGDSDRMRIGDPVVALGYPLTLGFSVTTGIISGIGRNMQMGGNDLATYIQTDADITFGNSGGPLVDVDGKVIGINTMIVSRGETFGFAIPANLFANSVDQLRTYGRVKRGALGIMVTEMTREALEYYNLKHGAMVRSVTDGMPAKKAGISPDDVILSINGNKIRTSGDVVASISSKPPGASVDIEIFSEGRNKKKTVVLGDRGSLFGEDVEPVTAAAEDFGLGFSARQLSDSTRRELELPRSTQGLLVEEVKRDSMAASKGLRPGLVITQVNRKPVGSINDVEKVLKSVPENGPVPVRVIEVTRDFNGVSKQERTIFLRKQ